MCVSPLKGFQHGFTDAGKPRYIICSYNVNHIEVINKKEIKCYSDFESPYANKIIKDFIEIPCNQCHECRLKYARDWANRCMLEAKNWKNNYFVTLTYDDSFLPFTDTGLMTLKSDDLCKFLKRLRRHFEPDIIRFYACGEYGDSTKRPHYHLILFNLNLDDLVFYKQYNGSLYFNSPTLEKLWPYGYVVVGACEWKSCAYVARYVMKKQKGLTSDLYTSLGIESEFVRMSRRPGIAREYIEKHMDEVYLYDELIVGDDTGGRKSKPPRYFDKVLEHVDRDRYDMIKKVRKNVAEQTKKNLLCNTTLSYLEILKNREYNLKQKTSVLVRTL